jgi:hypothetical protein
MVKSLASPPKKPIQRLTHSTATLWSRSPRFLSSLLLLLFSPPARNPRAPSRYDTLTRRTSLSAYATNAA